MNIEELKKKHSNYSSDYQSAHIKLSIEFAIGILEEISDDESDLDTVDLVWNKIQELRTYLDGNKD